jgi:cysteinyl-tRNA synthetase
MEHNLKIFNTLTRKLEDFKPLHEGHAHIYTCGPTVYWFQHIGNLRYFIFSDTLKRVLMYDGYKVKHVINITDVGHLTSDEDSGEDKMVKAIKREGLELNDHSMLVIADKYWKALDDDLKKTNVIDPSIWSKATEHIGEMLKLIQKIEKNGFTYKTSVGLIFDTGKFPHYTQLSGLKLDELNYGDRVEVDSERRNPSDFALWITNQPNHIMLWDSPWGRGFPGWHIECSAMSMKYLGEHFDIHTGGQEHVNIHHTNEIAQSESATGKKFVNYWMHIQWLLVKGEKMSKSKGSIYTLSELEKLGYAPLAFRYFCLTAQYRSQLNFSLDEMTAAQNTYTRLKNIVKELHDDGDINRKYLDEFVERMNQDLDTPGALAVLWRLVRDKEAKGKLKTIVEMDKVLGLDLTVHETVHVPAAVQSLVDQREQARKAKDFGKADQLRDEIKNLGFTVSDSAKGPKIEKI